jgi:hypothetical protein
MEGNFQPCYLRLWLSVYGLGRGLGFCRHLNQPVPDSPPGRHAAASYGHLDLINFLVSKGGDVNVKARGSIMLACRYMCVQAITGSKYHGHRGPSAPRAIMYKGV